MDMSVTRPIPDPDIGILGEVRSPYNCGWYGIPC